MGNDRREQAAFDEISASTAWKQMNSLSHLDAIRHALWQLADGEQIYFQNAKNRFLEYIAPHLFSLFFIDMNVHKALALFAIRVARGVAMTTPIALIHCAAV